MLKGLRRIQGGGDLHFITGGCYRFGEEGPVKTDNDKPAHPHSGYEVEIQHRHSFLQQYS